MKWSFKRLTHHILHVERATPLKEPTMRDNLRRYRAIRHALAQGYPLSPQGHFARHLNTLAALLSGIVGRQRDPTAPYRHEGPRWHQAREPRQTLCEVARQRPHAGG